MLKVHNDAAIDIAFGSHRNAKSWRNKEYLWSDLVARLQKTHYTAETHAEYMNLEKKRQDEIKDIGGFVGGYLQGGRRLKANVMHRQLITLDIDYGTNDFWADMSLMYDNAAVMYSTHKHDASAPRFRLIMPLDRPVRPDEYEAIARKIAGNIGIELFDVTTFEQNRLMYWPSTSKNSTYVYEFNDAPFICADDVLASYDDWTDVSEWPISERVNKRLQRDAIKQGDPLEKPGPVGAFCRSYTIDEVIEKYLSDVYEPCDVEDRYTFTEGSTAAGLIVYENKFAYSHHGTDPAGGKLCNAFDLVRVHKYGLKDEDAKPGTPSNKLPSYLAMVDLAVKDKAVKGLLISERMNNAKEAFDGLVHEDEVIPFDGEEDINEQSGDADQWKEKLEVDRKGNIFPTINNIVLILENDTAFKGKLAFDDFEKRMIATGNLPWRKITHAERFLIDRDFDLFEHYIETLYKFSPAKLLKAFSVVAERTKFHPIKDYLDGLQWDNVKRVDTLFIDYLGAEDTPYTRAVTRKSLCAAAARIFTPGCKYDYMPVFQGPQGLGKSSLIGKLGGEWYSDTFYTVKGKEAFEQMQGVWLGEFAELSAMRDAEVESVKHFISKRSDRYRVAFGRLVENFPRQFVPFGSTNKKGFLKDRTGNRRFWPVSTGTPLKNVHDDFSEYEVSQVWAEVMELYSCGEPLYLSKVLEEEANKVQEEHSEEDERLGLIMEYLDTPIPGNWASMTIYEKRAFLQGDGFEYEDLKYRNRVCAAEIYYEVMGGMQKDLTPYNTRYIHDIMRSLPGWAEYKSRTVFQGYGNQKGYYRVKERTTVDGKNTTVQGKFTTVDKNRLN